MTRSTDAIKVNSFLITEKCIPFVSLSSQVQSFVPILKLSRPYIKIKRCKDIYIFTSKKYLYSLSLLAIDKPSRIRSIPRHTSTVMPHKLSPAGGAKRQPRGQRRGILRGYRPGAASHVGDNVARVDAVHEDTWRKEDLILKAENICSM